MYSIFNFISVSNLSYFILALFQLTQMICNSFSYQ